MAKKLSKVKRANLVAVVKCAAWLEERNKRAQLQAQAVMLDYRGRTRHQVIW